MFWLLIILLLLWAIMIPVWPYHRRYGYGYFPFGIITIVLLVFLGLWLFGVFAVAI